MSSILRVLKLVALIVWIAVCFMLAWPSRRLGKGYWRDCIAQAAHKGVLRIAGIKLTVSGELASDRPLLLVTNHISYLDVPILGSQGPIRFTPKQEIAGWPGIGSICRVLDCIFVDRRPEKVRDVGTALRSALANNEIVCLFPEATTGNGIRLLPFKSGFFSLAEEWIDGKPLHIQPAAITYRRVRQLPIDTTQWPEIAWYGDMELVPHLWQLLALAPIHAELAFLPPVTLESLKNRKLLAAHCHRSIADAIDGIRHSNI